jgi:hypothetical protein
MVNAHVGGPVAATDEFVGATASTPMSHVTTSFREDRP